MSVFMDKENAPVGFQYQPNSLKAGRNNPGVSAIKAKTVTTTTSRSTTARKPLSSVNSTRDTKKSSSGDGKGTKEWGDDVKGKVVAGPTDVKPTGARKKTGLVARPINENDKKENGSKGLQDVKKKNSFEKASMKQPLSADQKTAEIDIPKLDATKMHRGLDEFDLPDSPIEHMFFPLTGEEEDDFQQVPWPVDERPTAFIKDILRWGINPSRLRENRDISNRSSAGSSPVQCDYSMMVDLEHMSMTDDDEDEQIWSKDLPSIDALPPLPSLTALYDLFGEEDVEYFSHLE